MSRTSELAIQGLVGSRPKYTKGQALREENPQLFRLLDASPLLAFSETGLLNICHRFSVSRETLEQCINAYLRPGESPSRDEHMAQDVARLITATPELLGTLEQAAKPARAKGSRKPQDKKKAKGGRAKC